MSLGEVFDFFFNEQEMGEGILAKTTGDRDCFPGFAAREHKKTLCLNHFKGLTQKI